MKVPENNPSYIGKLMVFFSIIIFVGLFLKSITE